MPTLTHSPSKPLPFSPLPPDPIQPAATANSLVAPQEPCKYPLSKRPFSPPSSLHTSLSHGTDTGICNQAPFPLLLPMEIDREVKQVSLKFPILIHRLERPIKLLAQGFGKELFDRHVEFLGEDHG
jgi:hypothetical protein